MCDALKDRHPIIKNCKTRETIKKTGIRVTNSAQNIRKPVKFVRIALTEKGRLSGAS